MPSAGRQAREDTPRPPLAPLALLASSAAGLALHEYLPLPYPELHRGAASLLALASFAGAVLLLVRWHRQLRRLRARQREADAERDLQAQALASLYDGVVITDGDFRIRGWNRAAERMYGHSSAEVVGRTLEEVFESELGGGGGTAELLERVRKAERVQVDLRRRRKDGTWLDVRLLVSRVAGLDDQPLAYIGVHRDMTEERKHEEVIRAAQAQIELLTSRAPAAIFQYDQAEKLVFLNEMLCVMTGLPPERLLAGGWLQAVHPADQRRVVGAWRGAMESGAIFRAEFRIGVDGAPTWVHATAMQIHDDEGRPTGIVGVMTDVGEARRLKEQLGKAERMASLGTLAAGMSHEINNPLAAVRSGLAFAAEEIRGKAGLCDASEALADAQTAAERVARIVRELQAFAEARDRNDTLDAGAVAEEAFAALPARLRERGRFQLEAFAAPPVVASRQQLARVLGHLLRNACQALPAGGDGAVRVRVRAAADGKTAVEVVDNGPGIPAELLGKVFDPFFTTREVGAGLGLGLAVSHALVHAMGGELELESEPGRGTVARVVLRAPAASTEPTEQEACAAPEGPPARAVAS